LAKARPPQLRIELLGPLHDRADFSCGVEALDRYLKTQAGQDARKHASTAFVLFEQDSSRVLGYYTLSATSIELSDVPESTAKKMPRYPLISAILLGRLAVDQSCRGRGFGEILLMDALQRCLGITEIGWTAIVVDAKDEAAAAFYERYEFIRCTKRSSRLFLLHDTVAALFK